MANTDLPRPEPASEPSWGKATAEEVAMVAGEIKPLGELTPEMVGNFAEIRRVQDQRQKLERVLTIWESYHDHERDMRKNVACWVFGGLGLELVVGNLAFASIGLGWFHIEQWVANVFYVGMYGQIATVATIIVKSLFPTPKSDPLEQLNDTVSKL